MASESRNRLRAATVGRAPQLVRRTINYYRPVYEEIKDESGVPIGVRRVGFEEDPIKVEVRQPTVKQRNDLIKKCRKSDGSMDEMEFIIQAAIHFTYDPESGERLFDQADYGALCEQPAGDFVDQFGGEAIDLLNFGDQEKKSETSKEMTINNPSTS